MPAAEKTEVRIAETFLRSHRGFSLHDLGPYEQTGQNQIGIYTLVDGDESDDSVFSIYYDREGPEALNKGIEKAKEWINKLRRCRACGCTEHNCSQCIAKTGQPCSWVEQDLCSACAEKPAGKTTVTEPNTPTFNNSDMNFFTQLASMGDVDMTIRFFKKGERFNLNVMPGNKVAGSTPLLVNGTAEELDAGFFETIMSGVKEINGLVTNITEVKKEAEKEAEENKKVKRAAPKKKAPAQKRKLPAKPPKKMPDPTKKKVAVKKKQPIKKEKVKAEETTVADYKPTPASLFDQVQGAEPTKD